MASKVAQKIAKTRASIAALERQAEGVQRQIEVQKIRLEAYVELEESSDEEVPVKELVDKKNKGAFEAQLPWDAAFTALRQAKGLKVFTTDDMISALETLDCKPKRATVRDRLAKLKKSGFLLREGDGRYRFAALSERQAA